MSHTSESVINFTIKGVPFTVTEVMKMSYGTFVKNGQVFYRGNIFDVPTNRFHTSIGMALLQWLHPSRDQNARKVRT